MARFMLGWLCFVFLLVPKSLIRAPPDTLTIISSIALDPYNLVHTFSADKKHSFFGFIRVLVEYCTQRIYILKEQTLTAPLPPPVVLN